GTRFNVAATATSGLPVAITTSGVCSVASGGSGSAVVHVDSSTGICTVHYNQSGNTTYFAAQELTSPTTAQHAAVSATAQWSLAAGGNGHWYQVVSVAGGISWDDAQADALSRGGYLATVVSAPENSFVFSLVDTPGAWLYFPQGDANAGPWIGGY